MINRSTIFCAAVSRQTARYIDSMPISNKLATFVSSCYAGSTKDSFENYRSFVTLCIVQFFKQTSLQFFTSIPCHVYTT